MRSLLKELEFRMPASLAVPYYKMAGRRLRCYLPGNDERRAIFIHVPKAAGSSLSKAIFGHRPNHVPLARFRGMDRARYESYFKFAFVRNPWDRLHSAYNYLKRSVGKTDIADGVWATRHLASHSTFNSFVEALADPGRASDVMRWLHFRPQSDWVSIPGLGVDCDFIGRFETLEEDFAYVCGKLAVDASLPWLRKNETPSYLSAYRTRTIDIVETLYARDISRFGYRFDEHDGDIRARDGVK